MRTGRPSPRLGLIAAALAALAALSAAPAAGQIQPFGGDSPFPGGGGGAPLLKVDVVPSHNGVHPGGKISFAVILQIPQPWHVNSRVPLQEFLIPTKLTFDGAPDLEIDNVIYPDGKELRLAFSSVPLSVYEGRLVIGVAIHVKEDAQPGPRRLRGRLKYQACNDSACLRPAELAVQLEVPIVAAGTAIKRDERDLFAQAPFSRAELSPPIDAREPAADERAVVERLVGKYGLLSFVFIFLGGLALNLTPCVYPLIPITVGFFGGQSEKRSIQKSFSLALVYVLGMALMYSVLGVVAASTGGLFGAALQSPWVLGFVSLVLLALALSSFGLFSFQVPALITNRIGGSGRKGYLGAALMGLTVGIVAAPCIGPFVVGLLLYVGKAGDPVQGFWMFFVLAMGLGFPYLVLGTFSSTLNLLPRSGAWMVWVKKVFGVILLGMAIYFLQPLLPGAVFVGMLAVCLVVGGLYLGFLERTSGQTWRFTAVKRGVGLVIAAAGISLVVLTMSVASPAWAAYDVDRLAQAKKSGKPVLIDFYADWCIPCKELDAWTFSDPKVIEATKEFVVLKADLTRSESPEVQELVKRHGIRGVPTVLFMDRNGRERTELRVIKYIPPAEFLERIRKAQDPSDKVSSPSRR